VRRTCLALPLVVATFHFSAFCFCHLLFLLSLRLHPNTWNATRSADAAFCGTLVYRLPYYALTTFSGRVSPLPAAAARAQRRTAGFGAGSAQHTLRYPRSRVPILTYVGQLARPAGDVPSSPAAATFSSLHAALLFPAFLAATLHTLYSPPYPHHWRVLRFSALHGGRTVARVPHGWGAGRSILPAFPMALEDMGYLRGR